MYLLNTSRTMLTAASAALGLAMAVAPVTAQVNWVTDTGNGPFDWEDAANWDPTVPTAANDAVIAVEFVEENAKRININGDQAVKTLTIDANRRVDLRPGADSESTPTLTIVDGAFSTLQWHIDLGAGGSGNAINIDIGNTSPTWHLDGHVRLLGSSTLSAGVDDSSAGTITFAGTGHLQLASNNNDTFFSNIVVEENFALRIHHSSGLGAAVRSDDSVRSITINEGGFLEGRTTSTVAHNLVVDGLATQFNGDMTFSGSVSGEGEIRKALASAGGSANMNLSGDLSAFTGLIHTTGGTNAGSELVITGLVRSNILIADATRLRGNGTIRFAVDDDDSSAIMVTNGGRLNISEIALDLVFSGTQSLTEYLVVDYSGAHADFGFTGSANGDTDFTFASVNGLPSGWVLHHDVDANQVWAVIPEPASLAMLGLGGALMLVRRRRQA